MTRKPDRFERMVRKGFTKGLHPSQEWIYANDAIDLLRREHRAVVRMITNIVKECKSANRSTLLRGESTTAYGWKCRAEQCRDILDRLKKRAS